MPRRLLSVVTPAGPGATRWLPRTHASLRRQALPDGWVMEWVIGEDGPPGEVSAWAASRALPVVSTVQRVGTAGARTAAALAARGEVLLSLDADDMVDGREALSRMLSAYLVGGVGYVVSGSWRVIDEADRVLEQRTGPHAGTLPPGRLGEHLQRTGRLGVPPSFLLTPAKHLWAAGGWPALAVEEDVALLVALSRAHSGAALSASALRSRRHLAQVTADPERLTPAWRTARAWRDRNAL